MARIGKGILWGAGAAAAGGAALAGVTGARFRGMIHREIEELRQAAISGPQQALSAADFASAPAPVRRYLDFALRGCDARMRYAHVLQKGRFKPGPQWYPISAEQHFNAADPAFVWIGRITPLPLFSITARDKYAHGRGNMLIKAASAIPLGNTTGPEMDVSSLARWFLETPWFPTALIPGGAISWDAVDQATARATLSVHGLAVTAEFLFNDQGEIVQINTEDRFRTVGAEQVKTPYSGYLEDYREFNGIRIPARARASWHTDQGELQYVDFQVTDMDWA